MLCSPLAHEALRLRVESLSCVVYECRSLERRVLTCRLPLADGLDEAPPVEEQLEKARRTQEETLLEGYWEKAAQDGNRETHYRSRVKWG